MSAPTFFYPELDDAHMSGHLSAAESAHALKSRRLKPGATVLLLNGRGRTVTAEVTGTDNRRLGFRINHIQQAVRPAPAVAVAVAIPKGNRQRTMVEMLTQLGVAEIIPMQCDYSVVTCKPETSERWSRYAIEACKQSRNPWLPEIPSGGSLNSLLSRFSDRQGTIVYTDRDGDSAAEYRDRTARVTAFVGPEGGFSPAEVAQFKAAAVLPVSLGSNVLRIETAAVAATILLQQESRPGGVL